MKAYRIKKAIDDLGIEQYDLFVQSPFHNEDFFMSRRPERPPMCHALILQFLDLYDELDVSKDEIPELMTHWRTQANERVDDLKLHIDNLLVNKRAIDMQIDEAYQTINNIRDNIL